MAAIIRYALCRREERCISLANQTADSQTCRTEVLEARSDHSAETGGNGH